MKSQRSKICVKRNHNALLMLVSTKEVNIRRTRMGLLHPHDIMLLIS